MELAEAIEIVVGQSKHERFRELTNPAHPSYHPRYVSLVIAMATGGTLAPESPSSRPILSPAPSPPAANPHMERLHLIYSCDYRGEPIGCGCNRTNHCGLGRGTFRSSPYEVSLSECMACIKG